MTETTDQQLTIVTAAPGSFADDSRLRSLLTRIRKTGAKICCLFPSSDLLTILANPAQCPLIDAIEDVISLQARPSS